MSFDPRIVQCSRFEPQPYQELIDRPAFPTGAMPEPAYRKLCEKYGAVDDVAVSRITYFYQGLSITGLMAVPKSISPGFHPIALYNRGGSREYGRLTVYAVLQMLVPLARAGYLVFASNYRGVEGGDGQEEFGGADVGDVLELLSIARTHEGWDRKNAYMAGHSRGGMMTSLAIRQGAKVNAAALVAPVLDIQGVAAFRPDVENDTFQLLIAGSGDARETAYRERSPLAWAEELTVPILLLHGEQDEAVPANQSREMAMKLTEAGLTHELVLYASGNHSLNRNWDDVIARIQKWFADHREEG